MASRASHKVNILRVLQVAEALKHLREKVVFIGGSIVGLLITDTGAPDVRLTKDVDIIVEVINFSDHVDTEEEIRKLGFKHDISDEGHFLRFRLDELIVDILPTDATRFGMNTQWYETAGRTAQTYVLEGGPSIRVVSPPLFLCTKLDAHSDRFKDNLRESRDFEDILAVIDGRAELLEEVRDSEKEVREFICAELRKILADPTLQEAYSWQLDRDQQNRQDLIHAKLVAISELI